MGSWGTTPLALWTLWRWRHQLRSPHVALPLWSGLAAVVSSTLQNGNERALLVALPGLACLAAFALPTLRRSVSSLIDWFALLFFSGCAAVIWVIWLAMMTGVPAKPAANVARLAPGFVAEFSVMAFAIAMLATTLAAQGGQGQGGQGRPGTGAQAAGQQVQPGGQLHHHLSVICYLFIYTY